MQRLLLGLILLCTSFAASALKNLAPTDVDLGGRWVVNTGSSDDAEAMLAKRVEQQMKRQRQFEERERERLRKDPSAWELEFVPLARTPQNRAAMEERARAVRQMLGVTTFLSIKQSERGAKLEIASDLDTRRFDAGSRSQVSMPQGQLADATSGWDGDWFVIERRAKKGPRISEKYRRLKKTDQLESIISIGGDSELAGMKVRRIFDRAVGEPAPPNAAAGPVP